MTAQTRGTDCSPSPDRLQRGAVCWCGAAPSWGARCGHPVGAAAGGAALGPGSPRPCPHHMKASPGLTGQGLQGGEGTGLGRPPWAGCPRDEDGARPVRAVGLAWPRVVPPLTTLSCCSI